MQSLTAWPVHMEIFWNGDNMLEWLTARAPSFGACCNWKTLMNYNKVHVWNRIWEKTEKKQNEKRENLQYRSTLSASLKFKSLHFMGVVNMFQESSFMNMHHHTLPSAQITKEEGINIPAHALHSGQGWTHKHTCAYLTKEKKTLILEKPNSILNRTQRWRPNIKLMMFKKRNCLVIKGWSYF